MIDRSFAVEAAWDGVHVGQQDTSVERARRIVGFKRWVGISTHTLSQVSEADKTSADYIAIGPIFRTLTKTDADPVVGLEKLRAARDATAKPLVAIGGITLTGAQEVLEAGADSLAVIGALLVPERPVRATVADFLNQTSGAAGREVSRGDKTGRLL